MNRNENHFGEIIFSSHYVAFIQPPNIQTLAYFLNINDMKSNVDLLRRLFAIQVLIIIELFMSFAYVIEIPLRLKKIYRQSFHVPERADRSTTFINDVYARHQC